MEPENKDTTNQTQTNPNPPNEPVEFDSSEMKIPQGNEVAPETNESGGHTIFYIILSLLLLGLFAAGGWYIWSTMPSNDPVVPAATDTNNEPEDTEAEAQTEDQLSDSDEIEAIEEDLENTDLDEIETELNQAEAELDALMQE